MYTGISQSGHVSRNTDLILSILRNPKSSYIQDDISVFRADIQISYQLIFIYICIFLYVSSCQFVIYKFLQQRGQYHQNC